MRYLNRIIFINSAGNSLKYAEIELNGNVHFIGNQGSGKSTLLRSILFFYTADIKKLGIPREKRNYNEYYFPYQNSYIVYEVKTEKGLFCVMTFKSRGRVAFRFFNAGYEKDFFIDKENRAFESWDKIRDALGKRGVSYTKQVHRHGEYRDIIYGNNKGLPGAFRRYALLESRQYQNIPRTIANVFLNAKLDAEFVKETIIKSLNEEEVTIDLATYSRGHLKRFEWQLDDIQKWTHKDKKGINPLTRQAQEVLKIYSSLRHLEYQQKELGGLLGYALYQAGEKQPQVQYQLNESIQQAAKTEEKLSRAENEFEKKKARIQKSLGEIEARLKDIREKRKKYHLLDIDQLLRRVNAKAELETEKRNQEDEKSILTAEFAEIDQRYKSLLDNLQNQLGKFINQKEGEKNNIREKFSQFKEDLRKQYEQIYTDIGAQSREHLRTSQSGISEIKASIHDQKIKQADARHKRFYEKEIETRKDKIEECDKEILKAETQIKQANDKVRTLRKEWDLEETQIKKEREQKESENKDQQEKIKRKIQAIDQKVENSNDSLYGWLGHHYPGWEQTIGKVIDEENVLFQPGLNPQKIADNSHGLYGIRLDLEKIPKQVTTTADLRERKKELEQQLKERQTRLDTLSKEAESERERLKKRYSPKIRGEKDRIQEQEYHIEQKEKKKDELSVSVVDLTKKGQREKEGILRELEQAINASSEALIEAEKAFLKIEEKQDNALKRKQREERKKIKDEKHALEEQLHDLDRALENKTIEIEEQSNEINQYKKRELNHKGAETEKIEQIENRLGEIDRELAFIEENRDTVADYKKDKRELFDREGAFKNDKAHLGKQLENEVAKFQQKKRKQTQELADLREKTRRIQGKLDEIKKDLSEFERFRKEEVFDDLEDNITDFSEADATDRTCVELIQNIRTTYNTAIQRYSRLQNAVTRFSGYFEADNLFDFEVKFTEKAHYFDFAEMLKEFIDEDKIAEYKKRFEERFADIIRQIGKETNRLIEKEGEIRKVVREINKDFEARNFVGAVDRMELKVNESAHPIFKSLVAIKTFNEENLYQLGEMNLFSSQDQGEHNKRAIDLLKQLIKEMDKSREQEIKLSDSFELLFRIVENGNDTGWVEKLSNVGSEGTDILVKAMINIMLLNVFKDKATKKHRDDFKLHCMLDEIGRLHPSNVKGILQFANDRNIRLINSSPTTYNATDYKYTYLLAKDDKKVTKVRRLVRRKGKVKNQTTENKS